MVTIQRERLKITVGKLEKRPLPASKIFGSPIIISLGSRFHCLPTFFYEMPPVSNWNQHSHKIRSNPQRAIERAVLDRFADVFWCDVDLATGRVRPTGGLVVQIGDSSRDF